VKVSLSLICLIFLLCAFGQVSRADEPLRFTIEQAIDLAMKANHDVKIARERLNKLDATIGEARSGALPQLTANAVYQRNFRFPQLIIAGQQYKLGFNNEYTAGASLNQAIYAAGKVMKALKAAKEETMSVDAILKDTREEIRLQVKRTFYQILLTDRVIDIKEKTLKQLTDQLHAIKKRYDTGIESDYTLMRQEVQVSNIQPELSAAKQQKMVYVNALKDLLALPPSEEVELTGTLSYKKMAMSLDEALVSTALSKRQDIEAKTRHVRALRNVVGIEFGGYLPSIGLFGNLNWQGQTDHWKLKDSEHFYSLNAGVGISIPIFDGLKTHHRISEAKAELKIASEEEMKLKSNVASEVKNVNALFKEAVERETSQKKALDLAQKAVDIASLRFSHGLTSQLELNDTILQRDMADQLYAQAVFDCLNAEATLKRVLGGEI